jgi:hypothetical protein
MKTRIYFRDTEQRAANAGTSEEMVWAIESIAAGMVGKEGSPAHALWEDGGREEELLAELNRLPDLDGIYTLSDEIFWGGDKFAVLNEKTGKYELY